MEVIKTPGSLLQGDTRTFTSTISPIDVHISCDTKFTPLSNFQEKR